MNKDQRENLRRLALSAQELAKYYGWFDPESVDYAVETEADKNFIAAANPEAVLALIARVEDVELALSVAIGANDKKWCRCKGKEQE